MSETDPHNKPSPIPEDSQQDNVQIAAKSLYGLTPKVEAAIHQALEEGEYARVRILTAPLHSADLADLLGRLRPKECRAFLSVLGDEMDSEAITYLDEDVRELVLDIMGPEAIAKALPELESDDAVTIIEELEPEERDEVLKNLPASDRVMVEQGLSYPEDSAGTLIVHRPSAVGVKVALYIVPDPEKPVIVPL